MVYNKKYTVPMSVRLTFILPGSTNREKAFTHKLMSY